MLQCQRQLLARSSFTLNHGLLQVQSTICMHNMPVEPTAKMLGLYTVYMCHHIKPDLVDTYLSGICHQLEPYFPDVWQIRRACLVHHTLDGCKHLWGTPMMQKQALTIADLSMVCDTYSHNCTYNNLLFCTQLCVSFFTSCIWAS